jgi:hypothetical protein
VRDTWQELRPLRPGKTHEPLYRFVEFVTANGVNAESGSGLWSAAFAWFRPKSSCFQHRQDELRLLQNNGAAGTPSLENF